MEERMMKLWLIACILVTWETVGAVKCSSSWTWERSSSSPAPAPHSGGNSDNNNDCDALIYKMVECVPYLGYPGEQEKPVSNCCSGFKKIMKVNKKCLCAALKSSIDLGIKMNITRVKMLPSTCGVSTHLPKCHVVNSDDHHSPSPAAPKSAPTPSKGGPAASPPAVPETPAPAPVGSTASTITTGICLLVSSWIIISCCIV